MYVHCTVQVSKCIHWYITTVETFSCLSNLNGKLLSPKIQAHLNHCVWVNDLWLDQCTVPKRCLLHCTLILSVWQGFCRILTEVDFWDFDKSLLTLGRNTFKYKNGTKVTSRLVSKIIHVFMGADTCMLLVPEDCTIVTEQCPEVYL